MSAADVGASYLLVRSAALLAAYAQALSAYHLAERPLAPSRSVYLVNAYNRFEACRYGYRGDMVEPYEGRKKKLGDDILDSLQRIAPYAERLLQPFPELVPADDVGPADLERPVGRRVFLERPDEV